MNAEFENPRRNSEPPRGGRQPSAEATDDAAETVLEDTEPVDDHDGSDRSDDESELDSFGDDDSRWDVFLPDDDELDRLPEPGDFWFDDG